jgi:hypothetical protein
MQCGLNALAVPGAMEAVSSFFLFGPPQTGFDCGHQNPDIVQEFFSCMDRVGVSSMMMNVNA